MSKKNKHKNKPLSWAKFIRKFCSRCDNCTGKISAKFCYLRYKSDVVSWKEDIFPMLSKTIMRMDTVGIVGVSRFDFEDVFCSNCNGGDYTIRESCSSVYACLREFNNQVRGSQSEPLNRSKKVDKPVPTFFTNNPEKWDIVIKKSLYGEEI